MQIFVLLRTLKMQLGSFMCSSHGSPSDASKQTGQSRPMPVSWIEEDGYRVTSGDAEAMQG